MKWIVLWMLLGGGTPSDAPNAHPVDVPASDAASAVDRQSDVSRSPAAKAAKSNERSITAIRRDVKSALRNEAKSKDATPAQHKAIGSLIRLHREIVRHSTFESGFAMKESRGRLQSRLIRIERDIRKRHNAPRSNRTSRVATGPNRIVDNKQPVLAQRFPNGGQPGAFGVGQGGAGLANGAANGGGIAAQGVGGQLPDFGPDLADLIQRVIDPDFWDVNGGPGTVVYFQPLKALVVSATIEVHEKLAGVAGQLRAVP